MPATTSTTTLLAACGLAACVATGEALAQGDPLGEPFPAVTDLRALDGGDGFRITGVPQGYYSSGVALGSCGDFNGDGWPDAIVGAPFAEAGAYASGSAYIVFGQAGAYPASVSVGSAWRFFTRAAYDYCGHNVALGGDVNGDGFDDAVICNGVGSDCFIVFGSASPGGGLVASDLDGRNGARVVAIGCRFSKDVQIVGDINGDGYDDIAVSGEQCDGAEVAIVFGRPTPWPAAIDASGFDGRDGFRLLVSPFRNPRPTVARLGDVNGDGVDDLGVAAPSRFPSACFVVFGRRGMAFPSALDLNDLSADDGITIRQSTANPRLASISGAADFNGDGVNDLAITDSDTRASRTHVVFGTPEGFPPDIVLDDLPTARRVVIQGADQYLSRFVGDVNNDGMADLLSLGFEVESPSVWIGRSYLVFGSAATRSIPVRLDQPEANTFVAFENREASGATRLWNAAGGVDFNGDGIDDFVTAPVANDGAYVVFGRNPPRPCAPDLDGDGELTIFDFLAFQNLFDAGDPIADFDGDGALTLFDFLAFQNAFDAGCP